MGINQISIEAKGQMTEEEEKDRQLASQLRLEYKWTIWYDDKLARGMTRNSYQNKMKEIGEFGTIGVSKIGRGVAISSSDS